MAPDAGDAGPDPAHESRELVDLTRLARAGDRAALETLVTRFYPRVLGIVRARLGPGLRHELESSDVVQEAMGEIVRGLPELEPRGEAALVAWLAAVVENRLRDLAKYHGAQMRDRGREVELASGSGSSSGLEDLVRAASADGPLERLARADLAQRVAEALGALEPRHAAALRARSGGASWAEVAAELALPSDGAARMLHARALVALVERLERGGLAPGSGASRA
jgi:RNA polymerase sigma factor (sigma-70 family)